MTMTPEHRLTLKRLRQARRALVKANLVIRAVRMKHHLCQAADDELGVGQLEIGFALEATDPDARR